MFNLIEIAQAGVISDAPSLVDSGYKILSFLLSIFGVVAIIMIIVAGMKYFLAMGDMKQITSAKKSFKAWVIGVIIALSGLVIVKFFGSIFQ